VLTSEGRSHPVAVLHQAPREREPLAAQVLRGLEAHWLDHREAGDTVLVFLPGLRELRAARDAIAATPWGADLECCLLHSQLPLAAQAEAIAPARGAAGKVVLATAIAESSLTLAGVQLVIDSGLSRASRFDPSTGMDGLVTRPASQASAEQRRGRAGRLGPGRCLRLWSPAEQQRRPAFDLPELLEADPLPIALLWTTAGALVVMGAALHRRLYTTGFAKAQEGANRFVRGTGWEALARRLFKGMGVTRREFILKDLRLFFRDATQWSQLILLAVLLAVYVFNIQTLQLFTGEQVPVFFVTLVVFLNQGLAGFVLAAIAAPEVQWAVAQIRALCEARDPTLRRLDTVGEPD
jgi:hypothetical protein